MVIWKEAGRLTDERIESFTEKMTAAYQKAAGKRAGNVTAFSLMVQEVLLRFRDTYGTETPCVITGQKRFGRIQFTISQQAPQADPMHREVDMDFSYDILASLGVAPRYTYSPRNGGVNTVTIVGQQKPRKNAMLKNMLAAILLAVLFSLGLKCIPESVASVIGDGFITPFFNKMIALLTQLATPFVFFAVVTGITGIGSQATVGEIGKKLFAGMMKTYLCAGAIFSTLAMLVYPLSSQSGGDSGFVAQIVQLVLDIIPDNLLMPFTIDNDLQVITVAVFVGVVMLALGERVKLVNAFCMECAEIITQMMGVVCRFLPMVVFFGVVNLLLSDLSELVNIYKMVLTFAVSSGLLIGYMLIRTKLAIPVPLGVLLRKQLATLTINLTTSSQVTALPENMKCCKAKFGIDQKMVDFGLPLGIVVYMPCGSIFLGLATWSLASLSGTPIAIGEVIKICFISIIVAIAAPPIPGSACAVMPIIFSSCGIPGEVFPVAMIMATFIGYLLPAINGYCLQLELLLAAKKLGLVDMDRLKREEKDTVA